MARNILFRFIFVYIHFNELKTTQIRIKYVNVQKGIRIKE